MLYGLYPVDVTSLSSPLTVQPIYETPLVPPWPTLRRP
jgi:hypothetical protein